MKALRAALVGLSGILFLWLVVVRAWAKLHPGMPCAVDHAAPGRGA